MIDLRIVVAVALRPTLWWTATVALLRLAPAGWWRRWPPVPAPAPAYAAFRTHTALGRPVPVGPDAPAAPLARLDPDEVVAFLAWCRRMESCRRTSRRAR